MITASFMKELTIVAKLSVLDVCRGPGYASGTSNYKPFNSSATYRDESIDLHDRSINMSLYDGKIVL